MKIVSVLNGSAVEGTWQDPSGLRAGVMNEPLPGFIRQVKLGPAGLVITCGEAGVALPMEVLMRMAESVEPALVPSAQVAAATAKAGAATIARLRAATRA